MEEQKQLKNVEKSPKKDETTEFQKYYLISSERLKDAKSQSILTQIDKYFYEKRHIFPIVLLKRIL